MSSCRERDRQLENDEFEAVESLVDAQGRIERLEVDLDKVKEERDEYKRRSASAEKELVESHALAEQTRVQKDARIRRLQSRVEQLDERAETLRQNLSEADENLNEAYEGIRRLQERAIVAAAGAGTTSNTASELGQAHEALHQMHADFVRLSEDRDQISRQLESARALNAQLQQQLVDAVTPAAAAAAAAAASGADSRSPSPPFGRRKQRATAPLALAHLTADDSTSGGESEACDERLRDIISTCHKLNDANAFNDEDDDDEVEFGEGKPLEEGREMAGGEQQHGIGISAVFPHANGRRKYDLHDNDDDDDVDDEESTNRTRVSRLGMEWTWRSATTSAATTTGGGGGEVGSRCTDASGRSSSQPFHVKQRYSSNSGLKHRRHRHRHNDSSDGSDDSELSSELDYEHELTESADSDDDEIVDISQLADELKLLSSSMSEKLNVSEVAATVMLRFSAAPFGTRTRSSERRLESADLCFRSSCGVST